MEFGVLAGYPVVDVKVTLKDGSYHEVDSSELAFKVAGSMAFKEAARRAEPDLLEPIMKVRGNRAGGIHGRYHRRRQFPARARAEMETRDAAQSGARPSRWRRLSDTPPISARPGQGRAPHAVLALQRGAA